MRLRLPSHAIQGEWGGAPELLFLCIRVGKSHIAAKNQRISPLGEWDSKEFLWLELGFRWPGRRSLGARSHSTESRKRLPGPPKVWKRKSWRKVRKVFKSLRMGFLETCRTWEVTLHWNLRTVKQPKNSRKNSWNTRKNSANVSALNWGRVRGLNFFAPFLSDKKAPSQKYTLKNCEVPDLLEGPKPRTN